MSLADLIRGRDAGSFANANPAKVANDAAPTSEPLAGLAPLALAIPAEARADAPCRHWFVHFADREPLEVIFAPEQTHAAVLRLYPAAIAAQPITDLSEGTPA